MAADWDKVLDKVDAFNDQVDAASWTFVLGTIAGTFLTHGYLAAGLIKSSTPKSPWGVFFVCLEMFILCHVVAALLNKGKP